MLVTVLHAAVREDAAPDVLDVHVQRDAVTAALERLGHRWTIAECDLDLGGTREQIRDLRPDVVFNLVESLGGHERLIHVVPALLDTLGVPYTGSPTGAVLASTDKLAAKRLLRREGLPVPDDVAVWPETSKSEGSSGRGPFLVKSLWNHGSIGLDDDAVVDDPRRLPDVLARMVERVGGPCLAEPYLAGRELNLSLLEGAGGAQVLPAAEIVFSDYPPDKPRIVGYGAKWLQQSFEYRHTPRRFEFPPADDSLLDRLSELALAAWRILGLRGYARVDFRLDDAGRPFILEVNVNPCLAPDAGFAAAARRAGLPFDTVVERILDAARVAPSAALSGSTASAGSG